MEAIPPLKISIAEPPPWSARLGAYAGLGLHMGYADTNAQSKAGAELAATVRNLELGAQGELAELPGIAQYTLGGWGGLYLPLRGFADVSTGLGLAWRYYANCEGVCTPGEQFSTAAITLRLGVSDRVGGALGARVGADFRAAFDLSHQQVEWRSPPTAAHPEGVSGFHRYGGSSLALVITVALDWQPSAADETPVQRVPAGQSAPR